MPSQPSISSNPTLHALTERLASHSRLGLPPTHLSLPHPHLLGFPSSKSLDAIRQPAPPPQLPILQLPGRHQDGGGVCRDGERWDEWGVHLEERMGGLEEEDMDGFVEDMGVVLRREFDCWVEQCWTESFHHMFTHTLPNLLIQLILTGSTPTFLRRQIVYGGASLDHLFQTQMLAILYQELELRLSGSRTPEATSAGPSRSTPGMPDFIGMSGAGVGGGGATTAVPGVTRDGVCFSNLAARHGVDKGVDGEGDEHGTCLCQLVSCMSCFHETAMNRKGPISLLPFELAGTETSIGWTGGIENAAQARVRREGLRIPITPKATLPAGDGRGFVHNPKVVMVQRPVPMFPHPQMTDVLAVEEHLRWRLKEMGAVDPAVESRYGVGVGNVVALEGIELGEEEDEGSVKGKGGGEGKGGAGVNGGGKVVKVTRGKGKVRRVVNSGIPPKKDGVESGGKKGKISYLPKEWVDEDPSKRNMAIILTFRHFVKLLHQVATAASPFSYPSYPNDVDQLDAVHPIALYRRLTEPSVSRRKSPREFRIWSECMDKWAEELGAWEKTQGNRFVSSSDNYSAVDAYTRAISLDPKKTIYFSNRAVALNSLGYHDRAELDCKHILSKDGKNGKAFFQRAVARKGMGRWREAASDLKEVLRFQPGNESAKRLLGVVKGEIAKLPRQSAQDVLDF